MNIIRPVVFTLVLLTSFAFTDNNHHKLGDVIDEFKGVAVYYNGKISNVFGRNLTNDGYNLGLKWQCVEFIKRFYYQRKAHKMPSTYGHAKDYFDTSLPEVGYNSTRGLMQYKNISNNKPKVDDILVFGPTDDNPFGHVGIISKVGEKEIELVQQNWGSLSRKVFKLAEYKGIYTVCDYNALGWLRKE